MPYTITYPPAADNQVREFLRQINLIPAVTYVTTPGTIRVTDIADVQSLMGQLKVWGLFSSYAPYADPVVSPPIFLISLTPSTPNKKVYASGTPFTLVVKGDGTARFDSGCTVYLDGIAYATTLTDTNTLTVSGIDPTTLGSPRVIPVTVQDTSGGPMTTSNTLPLNLLPALGPAPVLSSLVPNTASAAAGGFTLTLNGSNFVDGDIVRWGNKTKTATFVSPTVLTVTVNAWDLNPGTTPVYVRHVDRQVSATVNFTVTALAGTLAIEDEEGPSQREEDEDEEEAVGAHSGGGNKKANKKKKNG